MVGAAREARQRLDDKFRAQRMSDNKRYTKKSKPKSCFLCSSDYLEEAS